MMNPIVEENPISSKMLEQKILLLKQMPFCISVEKWKGGFDRCKR